MNDPITRHEIRGLIAGALLGAAPPLLIWHFWGQFHPALALAWGAPLSSLAFPTGFVGALVGALCGHAFRRFKVK